MGILPNGVVEVQLSRGLVTWIDESDFELVTQFKWCASRSRCTYYAVRRDGKTTISLHRVLLNAPNEMHVDHINGNGLCNTRANLRLCTRTQNLRNTRKHKGCNSQFKGVTKHNLGYPKSWQARIQVGNKRHSRLFATELEAALWYDEMALEHFGEFAKLNFPFSEVKPDGRED